MTEAAQTDVLVQRLRQAAKDIQWEQPLASERERLAADALERLQADNQRLNTGWKEVYADADEYANKVLHRELEIERLRAEVVRLRAALRELVDADDATRRDEPLCWIRRLDAFVAARALLRQPVASDVFWETRTALSASAAAARAVLDTNQEPQ